MLGVFFFFLNMYTQQQKVTSGIIIVEKNILKLGENLAIQYWNNVFMNNVKILNSFQIVLDLSFFPVHGHHLG